MSVLAALETRDLIKSFEPVRLAVGHGVLAVLVLCVRHKVLSQFRLMLVLIPQVVRHLVAAVDLVADFPTVVTGNDDLFHRVLVLLNRARQFKPWVSLRTRLTGRTETR